MVLSLAGVCTGLAQESVGEIDERSALSRKIRRSAVAAWSPVGSGVLKQAKDENGGVHWAEHVELPRPKYRPLALEIRSEHFEPVLD